MTSCQDCSSALGRGLEPSNILRSRIGEGPEKNWSSRTEHNCHCSWIPQDIERGTIIRVYISRSKWTRCAEDRRGRNPSSYDRDAKSVPVTAEQKRGRRPQFTIDTGNQSRWRKGEYSCKKIYCSYRKPSQRCKKKICLKSNKNSSFYSTSNKKKDEASI